MEALPKVYVLDDEEQMRRALSRMLASEFEVIAFATAKSFLEVAPALVSGCLILDVRMPEIGGLDVLRLLAERRLQFPTVMITGLGEVSIAVAAMKAGAVDFVEKPFTRETILASVRMAQSRCAPTASPAAPGGDGEAARAALARLSPRELQVLDGLVAGLPNKTIGHDLGLSPRTVEMHRARIMQKMEVRSLSALVRAALAAGFQVRS